MQKQAKKQSNTDNWFLFDAKEKVLGRLSTKIAIKLMGKDSAAWAPNIDPQICVIVVNAQKVALTGKKEADKKYYRYSGYPGGLRVTAAEKMRENKSEELIRHAVKGMLPKNRMSEKIISRLYIYSGSDHPHEAQKPVEVN
jgi:large subunit ribosomal protein L13